MKLRVIFVLASAALLTCVFVLVSGAGPTCSGDNDGDGVCDDDDNCSALYNPGQTDADNDGYGNLCDADVDNNCLVGASDIAIVIGSFGQPSPHASDLDDNGAVGASDIALVIGQFGGSPGPSTRPCAVCPSPVGVGAGACPPPP